MFIVKQSVQGTRDAISKLYWFTTFVFGLFYMSMTHVPSNDAWVRPLFYTLATVANLFNASLLWTLCSDVFDSSIFYVLGAMCTLGQGTSVVDRWIGCMCRVDLFVFNIR